MAVCGLLAVTVGRTTSQWRRGRLLAQRALTRLSFFGGLDMWNWDSFSDKSLLGGILVLLVVIAVQLRHLHKGFARQAEVLGTEQLKLLFDCRAYLRALHEGMVEAAPAAKLQSLDEYFVGICRQGFFDRKWIHDHDLADR
jgi:hypothetical protein